MKKLCTILAALTLAVLCAIILLPAEAQAASTSDLTFILNSDGESYSVSDCNESASGSLTIPATYNGKPVTGIGVWAFYNCTSLTDITIPDSVTSIGYYAFCNCTSLTDITIPDSVTSIGGTAFCNCTSLTDITIPDSVTSIGDRAFDNCTSLTSVTIGEGVTSIGSYAFRDCASLTDITIPDSVTSIGDSAFSYCTRLTSITIPSGVTDIGAYAFSCCTRLTSITIPDSVTSISWGAFSCTSLTSITIPDSVTSIGYEAFSYCTSLTDITIPDSVTSIGDYAFDGCYKLTKVVYCGTKEQWDTVQIGNSNDYLTAVSRGYHEFVGGDCINLQTCIYCGTQGGEYQHIWLEATCTTNKFCFLCGLVGGDAFGHTWVEANCTTPKTCSTCGETEGDIWHNWKEVSCTEPRTCSTCGLVEGAALGHNWQDATCTTPKLCTRCGLTEGSALGHSYDDHYDLLCNTCGTSRLVEETSLKFLSTPGLSFKDYIGMQVLVPNTTADKYEYIYVTAVQATPDGDVKTVLEGSTYLNYYQMFEQQVVSWSMTEKVTLTLYAEKNGIVYQGQSLSASVEELALTKLATYKAQNNAKACAALVDMLNYGAAVQNFFGRNTDKLPNANLGEFAAFGSTGEPALAKTNAITGTAKVPVLKDNISMQAKVELQLLFAVDVSAYTPKAFLGGDDVTVEIDKDTYGAYGWTLIKVPVSAVNMRGTFTIALYDADGNAVTQIYNVSVEGYANARQNTDKHSIDVALLHYGDSVAAL